MMDDNYHLEDTGEEKDKGNQSNNTTDPARDGVHVQADDGDDDGDGGDYNQRRMFKLV